MVAGNEENNLECLEDTVSHLTFQWSFTIHQEQKVASKWPKYLDHSMTSELIPVVLKADADMAWLGS